MSKGPRAACFLVSWRILDNESDYLVVSLLLVNRLHQNETIKTRAMKLRRCCVSIRKKTKDPELLFKCKVIIQGVKRGHYLDVIESIQATEDKYITLKELRSRC